MKEAVHILEGVKRTCDPAGKTSDTEFLSIGEIRLDGEFGFLRNVFCGHSSKCDYGRIAVKIFVKSADSHYSERDNNLFHRLPADLTRGLRFDGGFFP
jgi:hypothetical protein